jgi:hypothetical protein
VAQSCQTPLKRTLRRRTPAARELPDPRAGFPHHGESPVAVNGIETIYARDHRKLASDIAQRIHRNFASKSGKTAFAQILGKLDFFQLFENLRRILLDYEPKPTDPANAAFNAPC